MTTIDRPIAIEEPVPANGSFVPGQRDQISEDGLRLSAVPDPSTLPGTQLSVIVPTRNETESVAALIERLQSALPAGTEVIFVDDSDDATGYRVRRLTEQLDRSQLDVRLLHRPPALRSAGLGGAVTLGLRRARGTWIAVLDADLQHPPELIAEMLETARERDADIVIASRYLHESSDASLSASRRLVSRSFATAARVVFPLRLRDVSDPLSGFFLVRRDSIRAGELEPHGFKILLEILGRHPELRVAEVGYEFAERYAGVSKASAREGGRYLAQLRSLRRARSAAAAPSPTQYRYNIQGLISIESDQRLPELARFRVRSLHAPADVKVKTVSRPAAPVTDYIELIDAEARVHYQESLGRRGFTVDLCADGDRVEASVSNLVARSPHVLYTNVVEPILRWQLVRRGYALVHAAAVVGDEGTCLITARTDTGKTTTMLKLLDRADYEFLSDDLVLMDATGRVLSYPKPLTISRHTVHAMNQAELSRTERAKLIVQSRIHSRGGRQFAFRLAQRGLPVASINAIAQIVVPPPKYAVDRLVPGVALGLQSQVSRMVIIERGSDGVRGLDAQEAIEILLENCADAYGFPPYDTFERFFYAVDGTRFQDAERTIITAALHNVPTELIGSSTMDWATHIATVLRPLGAAAKAS
jgi:glycosyltransferase involved in cell wall biosynthesis